MPNYPRIMKYNVADKLCSRYTIIGSFNFKLLKEFGSRIFKVKDITP